MYYLVCSIETKAMVLSVQRVE